MENSKNEEISRFKNVGRKVEKEELAWEMKGKLEKALNSYERLLRELSTFSPASRHEANEKNAIIAYLLMRKAGILLQTGKIESGETLMNQALEYAEQSRNPLIIARAKLGLGVFYGSAGRFKEGEKLLKEALLSFNQSTDYDYRQGAGWALLNLGGLYGKQEKWALANEKLVEAIKLLKTIQNWVGVASAFELKARFNIELISKFHILSVLLCMLLLLGLCILLPAFHTLRLFF